MKNRFSFFLLLIVWVTTSLTALGQVSVKELDAYIAKAVKDYETPGLAIAIIKDGQIVLNKGYGLRDLGKKDSVTANSIFGIASCSKAFTATAVGMLVDDGKLSWDDHVIDILPDFQLHDPYVTRELRVIDLLCHRAGFNTFDGDLLWYGTSYDRDEVVKRIRHLPLKNSLRYKYGYSNVMFITAGEVIEAVSGKSWDAFLKERIFTPLGMENTNTSVKDFASTTERAMPHVKGIVSPDINYDNSGPAASLNSSVNDLTKWMQFWLNGGKVGDQQLLSESSFRKITSSQTVENVSGFDQQEVEFPTFGSWREVSDALKSETGSFGISVSHLNGEDLEPVNQVQEDVAFAIGSLFKVYVLAAVIAAIVRCSDWLPGSLRPNRKGTCVMAGSASLMVKMVLQSSSRTTCS